ncbi:MAG: SOS response-associated peptidase [Acidobacteriota bacterium]
MCGRYTLVINELGELESRFIFGGSVGNWNPRYNAAPTQMMPVIHDADDGHVLKMMKWGLIPFWSKDESIGSRLINARFETLTEKPAFKHAVKKRRCIIPADGYYEWLKMDKAKVPMRIVKQDGGLFGLAGLWDAWQRPDGERIETFTIITVDAAPGISHIHNRMPLILPEDMEQEWLKSDLRDADVSDLLGALQPVKDLRAYPVSKLVNSPVNDGPECIVEVERD